MSTNFESDSNNYETACQWAEAELGHLLQRESGQYLEKIAEQPEEIANGLDLFASTMLGAIAREKYNDPEAVYKTTRIIIEYVVAGTFDGERFLSYPGAGKSNVIESVAETGIGIGGYHTTKQIEEVFKELSMERNEDTMMVLGALQATLSDQDFNPDFMGNPPSDNRPFLIGELVTGHPVLALRRSPNVTDINLGPEYIQDQKVA
ncbi:MAG TPA: hypothetical protein PKB09_02065 [Candidatus Saccharibacteria bacterium]|nr:hypothetical protein [Candidatus Saccharibacteria bacterium]